MVVVMVMMVVGSGANAELIASELLPVGRRIFLINAEFRLRDVEKS